MCFLTNIFLLNEKIESEFSFKSINTVVFVFVDIEISFSQLFEFCFVSNTFSFFNLSLSCVLSFKKNLLFLKFWKKSKLFLILFFFV